MSFQQLLCTACLWSGVPSGFSDKHSKNRLWSCFLIDVFCKKRIKGRWCESSCVNVNWVPGLGQGGRLWTAVVCPHLWGWFHHTFIFHFFCMHNPDVFAFLFNLILLYSINNAETYRFLKRSCNPNCWLHGHGRVSHGHLLRGSLIRTKS